MQFSEVAEGDAISAEAGEAGNEGLFEFLFGLGHGLGTPLGSGGRLATSIIVISRHPNIMTAAEKLRQLIQILPEHQISEVLNFAEFLHQKQRSTQPQTISPGTLSDLRDITRRARAIQKMSGLLKTDQLAPTDREVATLLEARRAEKYLR